MSVWYSLSSELFVLIALIFEFTPLTLKYSKCKQPLQSNYQCTFNKYVVHFYLFFSENEKKKKSNQTLGYLNLNNFIKVKVKPGFSVLSFIRPLL